MDCIYYILDIFKSCPPCTYVKICPLPQRGLIECPDQQVPTNYPRIQLEPNTEECNDSTEDSINEAFRDVVTQVEESILKIISRIYFQNGLKAALKEARGYRMAAAYPWAAFFADQAYQLLDFFDHWKIRGLSECDIASHAETRDWMDSTIRCIAWHRDHFKIAVASSSDVIRVYTENSELTPVLRSSTQKWITTMAWRPNSGCEMAVGCKKGVCIWTVRKSDCALNFLPPVMLLKNANQHAVISIQWNSDGTLLATASLGGWGVLIWDVDKMECTHMSRLGGPYSIVKWSPDNDYFFAATRGQTFRVWSTEYWVPERYNTNAGTIQAACWSPRGTYLLFVNTEDKILYRLQEQVFACRSNEAVALADLSQIDIDNHVIGGQAQALAWDGRGVYLAISFKDSSSIAIFRTTITKCHFKIKPLRYIVGMEDEYPSYICFQPINRKNSNSVLTIGWSSGRVQYFCLNTYSIDDSD